MYLYLMVDVTKYFHLCSPQRLYQLDVLYIYKYVNLIITLKKLKCSAQISTSSNNLNFIRSFRTKMRSK